MVNLMEKKNYDLTQITRVLLEIRDNCVPKDEEVYDDPKRMEKYDALNAAIDLINNPSQLVTGDTSDGYHTFNELYHHRAVLFIETPRGQATYHYDIDPYWDMFKCRELERAPEWDGHTPQEAIDRIGELAPLHVTRCKDCVYYECGEHFPDMRFCCRLHMDDGTPVRYNFDPNAFCSYGETPEERQQREAAEQDAWESMQMMCNPEDGSL